MTGIISKRRMGAAGWAVCAAVSLTAGCQTPGTQFAAPWAARADGMLHPGPQGMPSTMPVSPAFAQVAAGQHLPIGHAAGMPAAQPIVGSGGLVMPISYQPNGRPAEHAVQQWQQAQMHQQMQNQMQQQMSMQAQYQQFLQWQQMQAQAPMGGASAAPTGGPSSVQVVNGPNGPQYIMTEVVGAPTPPTTTYSAPGGGPTWAPAPPTVLPLPSAPSTPSFAPSETSGTRTPEPLPPIFGAGATGTDKTSGATLPAIHTTGPSLGTFPGAPPSSTNPVRLPPGRRAEDDVIPPAPAFIPAPN